MTPFNISYIFVLLFLVVRRLHPLATDAQSTIPEVVRILRSDFCINYLLTDLDKLEELFKHLIGATGQQDLLRRGEFRLPKWTSNRETKLPGTSMVSGNRYIFWLNRRNLFDSISWLQPSIIIVKATIQNLWLRDCDWDDSLLEKSLRPGSLLRKQLPSLHNFQI